MNFKRLLTTTALAMLVVVAAFAQDDEYRGKLKSYSFFEVQGGGQMLNMCYSKSKLMTPTAALSFGHFFTPAVGLRLHANGWQSKGGFRALQQTYKWKYFTGDVDLLLNVTNLFSKKPNHLMNLMLLGGVGINRAWDNNELKELMAIYNTVPSPMAWNKNRLSHNLRVGMRLETCVTSVVGVSMEVNGNSLDDRFNSFIDNQDDWQWTAMLGLSVRFGKKFAKPVPVAVPVIEEVDETANASLAPAPVIIEEKPKLVTIKVPETIHEEIFYIINTNSPAGTPEQLARIKAFMDRNANAKLTIVGYADKGTGSAKYNKGISERRANTVAETLVQEYGISRDRIFVDAVGDAIQPFAENDKNRCVIIDGEGSHEETREQK